MRSMYVASAFTLLRSGPTAVANNNKKLRKTDLITLLYWLAQLDFDTSPYHVETVTEYHHHAFLTHSCDHDPHISR